MYYIKELEHCVKKFFELNPSLNQTPSNLQGIYKIFEKIYSKSKQNDAYALKILNYIQSNLCDESKIKRKVTARDFEDLIATLINEQILDETKRKNKKQNKNTSKPSNFDSYISSNYREKADIKFDSGFKISVKTLLTVNKEINCGSFAREALFENVLTRKEYGGKRKAGLGSKGQFYDTLMKIQPDDINTFKSNFNKMVDGIFKDDILFFIKSNDSLDIYFLTSNEFKSILKNSLTVNFETFFSVINRYEGNSFRIERDIFLAACINSKHSHCISINFKNTNHSIFAAINNELSKINNLITDYLYSNTLDISKCDFDSLYKLNNIKEKVNVLTIKQEDLHSNFHNRLLSLNDNNFFEFGPVIFTNTSKVKEKLFTTSIYGESNNLKLKIFRKDNLLFSSELLDNQVFDKHTTFLLDEFELESDKKYYILKPNTEKFKILIFNTTSSNYKSLIEYQKSIYIVKSDDSIIEKKSAILQDNPIKYIFRQGKYLCYREINTNEINEEKI